MNSRELAILGILTASMSCHAQEMAPSADTETVPPTNTAMPADPQLARTVSPGGYVIGPSDTLKITVWKETALSGELLVRPDGMISMPLLGDVLAAGHTPLKLATDLEARLKKYMQSPNVTVEIRQIRSKVVYMLGEVGKKGPVEMTPGMTLLQAISSAGGLTDYANTKKIYILRSISGKQEKIPVRYKEALKGNGSLNLALLPGDTIVVP